MTLRKFLLSLASLLGLGQLCRTREFTKVTTFSYNDFRAWRAARDGEGLVCSIVHGNRQFGATYIFGIPDHIVSLKVPTGARARLRLRSGEFAEAIVRHGCVVSRHYVVRKGVIYCLGPEIASNRRSV